MQRVAPMRARRQGSVETGSRQENASKQKTSSLPRQDVSADRAGPSLHGSRPDAAISAGPIGYPNRCHRFAGSSPRRFRDVPPAMDLLGRSATRVSRYSHTNRQPSAGRFCGSGSCCQRQCCPRPISCVGVWRQRAAAEKGCMPFGVSWPFRSSGSRSPTCRWGVFNRERLKIRSSLEPQGVGRPLIS
jgi:hypothetical protein